MVDNFPNAAPANDYVAEDELHAYVDGRLSPERRGAVEAILRVVPAERERVHAYRRQNIELHQLFDRPAYEPAPEAYRALAGRLAKAMRTQAIVRGSFRYAAAMSVAAVAATVGWSSLHHGEAGEGPSLAFTRQATEAHLMLLGKGYPGEAGAPKAEGKLFGWLSQQFTGLPAPTPDLSPHGFDMTGGRILPTGFGPAVQLLYENKAGRHVTLFVGPVTTDGRKAFTVLQDASVSLVYWQVGKLRHSLIGNVERETLLTLAESVMASARAADGSPGSDPLEKPRPDKGIERSGTGKSLPISVPTPTVVTPPESRQIAIQPASPIAIGGAAAPAMIDVLRTPKLEPPQKAVPGTTDGGLKPRT